MTQDASSDTSAQRKASTQADLRALAGRTLSLLAAGIRILTVVFAAVLVIHVVLAIGGANPVNGIAVFFRDFANNLTLGMGDLFLTGTPALDTILNYGIPAVVWIIVGMIVSRLLDAIAP